MNETELTKAKPAVGSVIEFGKDPLSKKALQWLVIDQTKTKSLVISTEIVAELPFFCKETLTKADYKTVSWQNAFLREWLNNDFLNNSFSSPEKDLIELTALTTAKSDRTNDKVFVLNDSLFHKLIVSNKNLLKKLTSQHNDREYLRDIIRGGQYVNAVCLTENSPFGYSMHITLAFENTCGVRPVMWIKR